jgi:hypothetical protein
MQYGIDEETYQKLVENKLIKNFRVVNTHVEKKVIPDELIVKKTPVKVKNTEDKTLNERK